MTKEEVLTLLCEHFSEGMVRTIVDAIAEDEREECAKECEIVQEINEEKGNWFWEAKNCAFNIRARGQYD
jgi:hypothetical protein